MSTMQGTKAALQTQVEKNFYDKTDLKRCASFTTFHQVSIKYIFYWFVHLKDK